MQPHISGGFLALSCALLLVACGESGATSSSADASGLEAYDAIKVEMFDLDDGSVVALGSSDGVKVISQHLPAGASAWSEPVTVAAPEDASTCTDIDAVSTGDGIAMVIYCLDNAAGGTGTLAPSVAAAGVSGSDWDSEPLYRGFAMSEVDPGPIQVPSIASGGRAAVWITDQRVLLRWNAGEGFTRQKVRRGDDVFGDAVALTGEGRLVVARNADLLDYGKKSTRCGVEFSLEQADGTYTRELVHLGPADRRGLRCEPFNMAFGAGDANSFSVTDYGIGRAELERPDDASAYRIVSNTFDAARN